MRQSILVAAEDLFVRREYHEVTVAEVARRSGVAKGTVYLYFRCKQTLYSGIVFGVMDRLGDRLTALAATCETPSRKIDLAIRTILGRFWNKRLLFTVIYRYEHRLRDPETREWQRRREAVVQPLRRILEEAEATGVFQPVNTRLTTELLLGMLRGALRYREPQDTLDQVAAAVSAIFLRGAGAAPPAAMTAAQRKVAR